MTDAVPAQIVLADAEATKQLGVDLARLLRAGDLVVLVGDLGAGKTTLTQGIGAGLEVRGQVASPTFIIARSHRSTIGGPDLIHVDAYRIGSLDEIDALDLDATLAQAVTVVEWGQGWVEQLAEDWLEIRLSRPRGAHTGDADIRVAQIRAQGPRWAGVTFPSTPPHPTPPHPTADQPLR
ncbi:MAG: tRNA (adenosine(37)-N6)-threonylcarbamoyltransferase complex ATPase subunit type 1 TsaE [Beutenbergiaceae bacterium]